MWEEIINKLEVRSLFLYPKWNQGLRQAGEKAQASLSNFRKALIAPKKLQTHFSVNVVFPGLLKDEHLWLEEVREEDGKFTGVVSHPPRMTKAVKQGQLWTASPETICDWMYVDNGKLAI